MRRLWLLVGATLLVACSNDSKGGGVLIGPGHIPATDTASDVAVDDGSSDAGGSADAVGPDAGDVAGPDADGGTVGDAGADAADAGADGEVTDSATTDAADSATPDDATADAADGATPDDASGPGDATDSAAPEDAEDAEDVEDAGACVPGGCDDGDPCTVDTCGPAGCSHDLDEWCCAADADCEPGTLCEQSACVPACAAVVARQSHLGCEFWATDLDQFDEAAINVLPPGALNPPDAPWGIMVSNPGPMAAQLTFSSANTTVQAALDQIAAPAVPPGGTATFTLPSMSLTSSGVTTWSVRVLSNQPVSVVQANPLDVAATASSDTSLLLPVHLLGAKHVAMTTRSTPSLNIGVVIPGQRSTVTVIAVADGTTDVTITAAAAIVGAGGVAAMAAGESHTFSLQRYEVLNLEAQPPPGDPTGDLTGTLVESSQPVVVFAGHEEASVSPPGSNYCCADHIEDQMLPVAAWGVDFLAAKTRPRGKDADTWRVVASAGGTNLTTDPPVIGLHGITLDEGEWAEGSSSSSFRIQATNPIQVAQYTVGGDNTSAQVGDPTLMLTVSTAHFASVYTFHVPTTYPESFVTVVRPVGALVVLDGAPVALQVEATIGGHEVVYVPVAPGAHRLESTAPFGASLYGWHDSSSYGHPLGLEL